MRNRLLAGLLAGALFFQGAGTSFAAEDAADLTSSTDTVVTEAADDGASVVMSDVEIIEEEDDEAGSGAGNTAVSEPEDILIIEEEEEAAEEITAEASTENTSGSEEEAVEVIEDGAGDASSGASSEDAADAASSETSYPDEFFDENATGFFDADKGYEVQSVTDQPISNRKRLLRSASYPSYYVTDDLPELRNQNPYGACWAFAMTGLSEINLIKNSYYDYDLSELHLAYFAYHSVVDPLGGLEGDNVTFSGPGPLSLGGNSDFASYTLARWTGLADESTANYVYEADTAVNSGLDPTIAYDDVVHMTGYYEDVYDVDNLTPVKKMVTEYGAAGINFYAYNSMAAVTDDQVYNRTNNCYYNSTSKGANHAVIIVGWDDEFSRDKFSNKPAGDGAWLIRNSWTTGNEYSYSGYFWMSYYEASIDRDIYAVECRPRELGYDHNYQYDGGLGGMTYQVYQSANVFTAASGCEYGESLEAVSFKTPDSNVNYTIEIYKDLQNANDPASGTLASTRTGTTSFAGFYEVELSEKVLLEEGETFSVVIGLTKGSDLGKMCFDRATSTGNSYGTITSTISSPAGQSFCRFSSSGSWMDLGASQYSGNFRIKAYTNNRLSPEVVAPESITFDELVDGRFQLGVNASYKIAYTVLPENASDKSIVWTSSDTSVCKVSNNGYIRGVSKGTATITGTTVLGHVAASFEVDVDYVLTSIIVSGYSTPRVGETRRFLAYANPGEYEFKESVTWSSSNPSVASVSSDGTVTALKPGKATIYASADGKQGSLTINVFIPESAYSITLQKDNSVKVTWNPIEDATGYYVLRGEEQVAALGTDATEYVDTYYAERSTSGETVTYVFRYIIDGVGYRCSKKIKLNYRYKINYHMPDGATNNPDNPDYYTKGVGVQLLDPVPPAEYNFVGWFTDEAYTNPKSEILSSESGEIDLYGLFERGSVGRVELVSEGGRNGEIPLNSTVSVYANVYGTIEGGVPEDDTYEISYVCKPEGAALVSSTGTDKPLLSITAKSGGSVTVIATSNGHDDSGNRVSASKTFMIYGAHPESLTITPSAESGVNVKALKVGQNLKLSYLVAPTGADKSVSWTSSDQNVAEITENNTNSGYVTVTAKKVGSAYINAVSNIDASVRNGYWIEVVEDSAPSEEGKELILTDTSSTPEIYGSSSGKGADLRLAAGKSFALKAVLSPAAAFTSKKVFWSSGNSAIATVNSSGRITAKSAGYTIITAISEDGGLEAACRVNVYDPVKSIVLDKKTLKLPRKGTGSIKVEAILPTTASDVVTFESSNPNVAEVNEDTGVVTAGDTNGTAVITVYSADREKSAKCTVTVGNPVTGIEVKAKGDAKELAAGKTLQLSAAFNEGAEQPLDKSVTWSIVKGEDRATISKKGVLKGIKEGYVTVRATSSLNSDIYGERKIGIYVPVTKAAFNVKKLTLAEGGSYQLRLNFTTPNGERPTGDDIPEDGENRVDMWVDCSVLDSDGSVIPNYRDDDDPATLTLRGDNYTGKTLTVRGMYQQHGKGLQTLTCKVTVAKGGSAISGFKLSKSSLTMNVGTTAELSAGFTPMAPANSLITWKVDEKSPIRFVDEDGNQLTEIKTGSDNGEYSENKVTVIATEDSSSGAVITATTDALNAKGDKRFRAYCNVALKGKAGYVQIKQGNTDASRKKAGLATGKSMTLKASVFTDSTAKTKAGNQKVNWTVEETETPVVTVTSSGKVVAVGAGKARIYAESTDADIIGEGFRAPRSWVDITVYNAPSKVTLDKAKASMSTAAYNGNSSFARTKYSSLRQYDVVTANITPVSYYDDEGAPYNTVKWTAGSDIIEVKAIKTSEVTGCKTGYEKQTVLEAYDIDDGDTGVGYVDISSGKYVTTERGQSLAIAARKPGTVKLTATTSDGKKVVCTITVYASVTGLDVETGRIKAYTGEDQAYDYKVDDLSLNDKTRKTVTVIPRLELGGVPYSAGKATPAQKAATAAYNAARKVAVNTTVNYRSSNTSVATVNAKGVITAVGQGTAVITVSTADGTITKRILVEVK